MIYMDLNIDEMAGLLKGRILSHESGQWVRRKVSLCTDSRKILKGQVFWALKGDKFDGHKYVEACFKTGALAAVVDENWIKENSKPGNFVVVGETNRAFLNLGREYSKKFHIPKIALTGSNGKTTTKDMLVKTLRLKGKVHGTIGNFNNHIGVPLTLFGLKKGLSAAVIEIGTSAPGEIKQLSKAVGPDIGIITNIGYSHTEFLGSLQGVFREKSSIVQGFKPGSILIVNGDDPYLKKLKTRAKHKVITFGINYGDLRAKDIRFNNGGCAEFKVNGVKYKLRIPGKHNIYNALAVTAAAGCLKIPMEKIASAINGFKSANHRMEIKNFKGIKIIDDCYNANPTSTAAAIEVLALSDFKGKSFAVLGDMRELGGRTRELHYGIGKKLAEKKVNEFYGLGSHSKDIAEGAAAGGMKPGNIHLFADVMDLAKVLSGQIHKGDVILVKGSRAMEMEKVAEHIRKSYNA